MDTSAKTGCNVRPAFMSIVKELLTYEYPWGKFDNMRVRLDGEGPPQEEDSSSAHSLISDQHDGGCCCVLL